MELLNAVIDALAVIVAHIMIGLFSAPLKYKKWVSIFVWCVWGLAQTVLFIPAMISDAGLGFGFIVGFIVPYVGQYVLFFIMTKGKLDKRLFMIFSMVL